MDGILWLLLGAGFCAGSFKLKIGTLHNPGAGFIPFLVGSLLIVLGLFMVLSPRLGPGAGSPKKEGGETAKGRLKNLLTPLYTLLVLFGYVLLLDFLGFIVSSSLFLFFLFKISDPKKWFLPVGLSVTTVLISYLLFSVWLQGQFPRGILGF